jgi:hypothetical protein
VLDLQETGFGEHLYLPVDGLAGEAAIGGDAALRGPALAFVVGVVGEFEEDELG